MKDYSILPDFVKYLAEENIVCHTSAATVEETVREMAHILAGGKTDLDPEIIREKVMERESVMSTVIVPGLAVPHARIPGLQGMLVAMVTSLDGIDFHAPGFPPVHVAVMILTPEDEPGLHLQVVSALALAFRSGETAKAVTELETPAEIIRYFTTAEVAIPKFLRANDIVKRNIPVLKENDTLRKAIEIFAKHSSGLIPVIDDENDLRGVISLKDILHYSLPEHLLWMNDLSSIDRFQPFAEALATADETKLADVMREEYISVNENVPAIQLAKLFLLHNEPELIVTDANGRLAGIVALKDFCASLLWQ